MLTWQSSWGEHEEFLRSVERRRGEGSVHALEARPLPWPHLGAVFQCFLDCRRRAQGALPIAEVAAWMQIHEVDPVYRDWFFRVLELTDLALEEKAKPDA